MLKTTIIAVFTVCLSASAYASGGSVETSASEWDLSTFETGPFPDSTFTAENNYLLLFDELSGKIIYGLFAETQSTKSIFLMANMGRFFCCNLEIDSLKINEPTIHGRPPTFVTWGGSTIKSMVTNADDRVSIPAGNISGITTHIWEVDLWPQLGNELRNHEKLKLCISGSPAYRTHINTDGKNSDPRYFAEVSRETYARLQKYKTIATYRPFTVHKVYNIDDREYRRRPVQLSKENETLKTHGPDHDFAMLLDRQCGLLAVFLEYADTKEPRDLDILKIAGRTDRDSLKAVPWNYWSSGMNQHDADGTNILKASEATLQKINDQANRLLQERPELDTVYTIRRDQIFGTVRPIWELEIWDELGRRIKESRNAYILYFNDEDIQYLKKPAISQHYLVVTGQLYEEMEALRKAMEKKKKREEERETLKEMMAQ